jgi:hypothetical protein
LTVSSTCIFYKGKNEIMDELAKLDSSRAMVPSGVFMQERHEPGITNEFAKASKAAESSQEISPLTKSISKSPKVMEINLDWCTPFMIYLGIGGLPEDKDERD